jgi:uncharacterized CHY-type Zn-finger protein
LGLFASGFAVFMVVRWFLIPSDFGVYGFYRAGALVDARAVPVVYAGEAVCLDCHSDVGELRAQARHEIVRCEACHGPLKAHADDSTVKPRALNPRLICLTCHTAGTGQPETFPQIGSDHADEGPCTQCHKPHRPRTD